MANRHVVLPVTRETLINDGVYQKLFQPPNNVRMNQVSCVSNCSGPGIKYCMTMQRHSVLLPFRCIEANSISIQVLRVMSE